MKRADHHLIQQVLDGDVSQEEFARFQQRMREEPELMKHYQDYALLHHTLCEELEHGHAEMAARAESGGRTFHLPWLLAAAAVLALTALAWQILPWLGRHPVEDVAVITFSVDAVWQIDGESRNLGGATGVSAGSKLHLRQGRASISTEPAVNAVLEGAAEMAISSANTLHLESGRGYFHSKGTGGGLTVSTPRLTAMDSGTEFGIETQPEIPDEVRVMEGKVRIVSKSGNETTELLAGESARVPTTGPIERIPPDPRPFAKGLGRFKSVLSGPFEKAQWRVAYGTPSITGSRIDGDNYAMFLSLSGIEPALGSTVMLATLDIGKPLNGEFHTDGWSGLSFFSEGSEVLFFGDSYGTGPVWSLDVKQSIPVIVPENPVSGPGVITLRYDPRSGDVSLHEGEVPLKPAFCSGKIPPHTHFDEIRIGASAGAALAVKSIHIRVCGD